MTTLQRKLKSARRKLGLTQVAMAAKLEAPASTYIKWEQGISTPPVMSLKALNAAVDALLGAGSSSLRN
jgi:DNA-binding transcriptional regulator YiaG